MYIKVSVEVPEPEVESLLAPENKARSEGAKQRIIIERLHVQECNKSPTLFLNTHVYFSVAVVQWVAPQGAVLEHILAATDRP